MWNQEEMPKQMRSEVITVTSAIAAEWLKKNIPNNRPLSKVNDYAQDMKDGKWYLSHQGIAFDVHGNLIDGQNRLHAVIKSGVTVKMLVFFDCDPETLKILDTGKKRTLSDHLHFNQVPSANHVASVIAKIIAYDGGDKWVLNKIEKNSVSSGGFKRFTQMQNIEFFEKHKDTVLLCADFGRSTYRVSSSKLVSASDISIIFYILGMSDDANKFISSVILGIGLKPDTSAYALRRFLEECKNGVRKHSSSEMLKYWILAFQKRNLPTKVLRVSNK